MREKDSYMLFGIFLSFEEVPKNCSLYIPLPNLGLQYPVKVSKQERNRSSIRCLDKEKYCHVCASIKHNCLVALKNNIYN